MSCTWSNFEEHLRKYLSNNDEQIVEILKRKFFQTTHEFQKTEASKTVLDKCIAEAASNPDRIYVILNDLKATFKLNAQKTDKKHHPGVTKRRVEIKTLHHASSHTKPQDSSDSCTDHTSPKHSSLPLNSVDVGNDDDDVIIVDSPESPATVQPPSKVDQLSHQPKSPATPSINEKQSSKSTDGNDTDSSDVQNDHRYRMIARLEHLLVRLSQCIRELEEKELDFNELDSSNSAYLKVDILKRQYLKAWRRLCEIRNVARISGRILRRKFTYSGCQYPKVNEKIEEIVNKKKLFPDFSDVYQIVSSVNKEENLKLTGSVVKSLAREVFVDVGHLLKQRRQDDLKRDFGCHLTDDICDDDDPTYSSRELRRRLTENKRLGDTNLNKVFKHFIDLQHTVQSVVCKNEAISDVSRQRRPLDLSCKTASTSSEIYTSKEAINPSKNHKSEDSPTTSDDEVFTLSSDSDEETEKKPTSSPEVVTSSSLPAGKEIACRNNELCKSPIHDCQNRMIINNGSSDSPAPYSPTTIDLIDDDDDDTPSPTSSISEPPQKLSRLDNCVPASNSCINNNDKLPFSTSFHQETRQSSQVVTVATRYGPHGIETMSHMASAHIVHRYPVTTTLITNKASTRHYTSNCLSMTRIGSHQSSLRHFTSINNNNNNPPTIVKIIRTDFPVPPNSSPLSSTNPMSNAIVPVTVSNTCENETIELD